MRGTLSGAARVSGTLGTTQGLSGTLDTPQGGGVPYTGEYVFTPSEVTQEAPTQGLLMEHNVIVEPIPENYARMSWNGSVVTFY